MMVDMASDAPRQVPIALQVNRAGQRSFSQWNELNPVLRQRGIVNMIKNRWMMIDLEYAASRQVSIASEVNTTD